MLTSKEPIIAKYTHQSNIYSEWMTTKQIADFLGITRQAVDDNYQRNKIEFTQAGEVRTLKGADLREFQEDSKSDLLSSKEPILAKYTNQSNIYSPQGVLRMSWISHQRLNCHK